MVSSLKLMITACVLVMILQSPAAIAQQSAEGPLKVPPTPSEIQVPAGNSAYLAGHAVGTQNYICQASAAGLSWKFLGPQATLFVNIQFANGAVLQQLATHFLSPNPVESGLPRATWQSSLDTSAVWAKAIASSTDPNFVTPGAIPWLLLQAVGAQFGPTHGSTLAQTTFIHRLNTSGGAAPVTGCSQSTEVGSTVFVPYTADYYFYKAGK